MKPLQIERIDNTSSSHTKSTTKNNATRTATSNMITNTTSYKHLPSFSSYQSPSTPSSKATRRPSLSTPLLSLFCLNGATLSLPSLALSGIVNDRASIPVELLSAYGAVCFLPWSLKPLYGWVDKWIRGIRRGRGRRCRCHRHVSIAVSLVVSGLSLMGMVMVPEGGVGICFVLGLLRGVGMAFPEFLLGLSLIDEARWGARRFNREEEDVVLGLASGNRAETETDDSSLKLDTETKIDEFSSIDDLTLSIKSPQTNTTTTNNNKMKLSIHHFNRLSGIFQAQAATSRNIGSLLASAVLLLFFIGTNDKGNSSNDEDDDDKKDKTISYKLVVGILIVTGCLPMIGSIIALRYKVGSSFSSLLFPDLDHPNVMIGQPPLFSLFEIITIGLFQSIVIWLGLKGVIISWNKSIWFIGMITLCVMLIILSVFQTTFKRFSRQSIIQYGPALFLILNQSLPQATYQWSSYAYYLFESKPLFLQTLSMIGNITATAGSQTYAQLIAPRWSNNLILVFFVTTIIGSLTSLLYLIPTGEGYWKHPEDDIGHHFAVIIPIVLITGFFGEIKFLPSVVLATNAVRWGSPPEPEGINNDADDDDREIAMDEHGNDNSMSPTLPSLREHNDDVGLQYGTYVGCIDFGDQIGAWLTVPVVSALGISRDDWSRLPDLLLICTMCSILSLSFLLLLPGTRTCQKRWS